MTPAEMLVRASSALGKGTKYVLGSSLVGSECDCSGFVAWCFGVPRKVNLDLYVRWNGGWFETTAIYRDAKSPYGFFREVPLAQAQPGDVFVWGDSHGRQGHIGIITEEGGAKVIHCSKGNWARTGDAVQETPPDVFLKNDAIVARWHEFDTEEIA